MPNRALADALVSFEEERSAASSAGGKRVPGSAEGEGEVCCVVGSGMEGEEVLVF